MSQLAQIRLNFAEEAHRQGLPTATDPSSQSTVPFGNFISNVLQLVMVVALLSVFFFLLFGAYEWIISGGDKGKLEAARNKMTNAIIGLVVLAASVAVYFFVQGFIGVEVFTQ